MPEILKSSSSCTTFSLLGSLGSLFLTCNTETQQEASLMKKGVMQTNSAPAWLWVETSYRFEQLDLIQGRLCVMLGTFHHLHGHKALLPEQQQPQKAVTKLIGITWAWRTNTHWLFVRSCAFDEIFSWNCANRCINRWGKKENKQKRNTKNLLYVPGQPHSGEVSPAQLTDHMVPPVEQISNLHMVIST